MTESCDLCGDSLYVPDLDNEGGSVPCPECNDATTPAQYQPTVYDWSPMPTWAEETRLHEEKKDLYGCHRNYKSMKAALKDLNQRARHDRVSTTTRKQGKS